MAAILANDEFKVINSCNALIKPVEFTIPPEATAIHHISTEKALNEGMPLSRVIDKFRYLVGEADQGGTGYLVAHNFQFDFNVIANEYRFLGLEGTDLSYLKPFCTMKSSIEICKIPGKYGKYKWPSLAEAYYYFYGEHIAGNAHRAYFDAEICLKIFQKLMELKNGSRDNQAS